MPNSRATRRSAPPLALLDWVEQHDGIVHRDAAIAAGYLPIRIREALDRGGLRRVRRSWIAGPAASPALVAAAESTGTLACVSAARHRGWWTPPDPPHDPRLHIRVKPNAASPAGDVAVHWSREIAPTHPWSLVESVEDTLQHVAGCLPKDAALTVWESAARRENLASEYLREVRWVATVARELAETVTGLADSGLETVFFARIRRLGLPLRMQVHIAGHRVDALIGDRLVCQVGMIRGSHPIPLWISEIARPHSVGCARDTGTEPSPSYE